MRHSVQEGRRYAVASADALLASAENTAVLNYLDPERVDAEAARAMLAADQRVTLDGGDDAMRETLRAAAASRVYSAVLARKVAVDPSDAAVYLESIRDRLTGEDATRAEATLRPVLLDADAAADIQSWINGTPPAAAGMPVFEGAATSLRQAEEIARASVGRTIGLESGGRADAKNPRSSATGAGQFIAATWLEMLPRVRPDLVAGKSRDEILALRNGPDIARQMTEAYAVENARGLYESGLPVTPQTVYLAHHFGLGGARAVLRADPNTPIARILPARDIAANPYLRGKTVAEVIANHQRRAGDGRASAPTTGRASSPGMAPARTADGKIDWIEIERRAQAIPNQDRRDRVLARARSMQSLEARAEAEAEKARDTRILQAINGNPNAPLSRLLSPQDYASAVAAGRLPALESYRESMAQGGLVQDDLQLVDTLAREAALNPQAFMRRNIAAEAHRLSTRSLSTFLEMQRKGGEKAANVEDWATDEQRLGQLFRLVGVGAEADAKGKGAEAKNEPRARHRGELRIAYQMAVEAHTRATGKKPEGEALDRIVRQTARNYAEARQQRGDDEPTTRMQRNEQRLEDGQPLIYEAAERYFQQFSEGQREQVRAAYRARYNASPPEWWVDSYLARTQTGGAQ